MAHRKSTKTHSQIVKRRVISGTDEVFEDNRTGINENPDGSVREVSRTGRATGREARLKQKAEKDKGKHRGPEGQFSHRHKR